MKHHVLITGGAGFIGSHLADELLRSGHQVRVLDSLHPQIHGQNLGPSGRRPRYLDGDVELMVGDVRSPSDVERALAGIDAVYHFAARVGVGQSMYQLSEYVDANVHGTAVLLERLVEQPVARLVVASSMSIYGEGLYQTPRGELVSNAARALERVKRRAWDPVGPLDAPLAPLPTPEWKTPDVTSVYAMTKLDQERLCLLWGRAYGVPTVALRFFNVYGPRQALSNPYTGVMAIFAARLLNGRPPVVFEDGAQRRDFVHVTDVARACRLALEAPNAADQTINIASGTSVSIRELAIQVASAVGRVIEPEITEEYRFGDVRHCFAETSLARTLLGFEAQVDLARGLQDLASWLPGESAQDRVPEAREELCRRGLTL